MNHSRTVKNNAEVVSTVNLFSEKSANYQDNAICSTTPWNATPLESSSLIVALVGWKRIKHEQALQTFIFSIGKNNKTWKMTSWTTNFK